MPSTKKFRFTDKNGNTIEVDIGAEGENVTIDGQKLTDLLNGKADKQNSEGGFAAGYQASSGEGGAVGYQAKVNYGGGAVGYNTETDYGGAMGNDSKSEAGCAIGNAAITSDGVAVGKNAKTIDSSGNGIDAIQLGTGTNSTEKTIQVYNYQLMSANGKIPADRLSSHASTSNTYGAGTSSNYGHVKLSDSTNSTSGVTDGTAATPSAVKAAYDLANSKASVSSALIPYADIYVDNVHISGRDDNYVTLECDNIDGILYTDANNIGIGEDFLIKDQIESRAKGETIDASDIDNITETGVYYVEGMINDDNEDEILLIVVRGNTRIAQYTFSDDDTIRYRTKTITGNWASGWGMIHDPHAAPINHASTSETYGLASATTFGHVRLSDNTTSNANVTAGIAATPAAVKAAYDLANSKAPTSHASTATTYGVGNSSSYGHLKLSSSTSSTSGTTSGIAATPSAVKAAYDKANIRKNTSSTTGDIITTHLTVGSRLADSSFGGSSLVTGQNNIASGDKTASIGGDYNTASGYCAATIGGSNVSVSSNYSGSIGGFSTTVTGAYSSIVGGSNNSVNGDNAAVVGGDRNTASGDRSVVIGGNDNTASGNNNSVVVGGYNNTASGESSITLGGNNNTASAYQTKVGHYSKTGNAGQGSGTSGDAFIVGNGSSITRSNAFRVAYSGSVYALSAFNSTGADYAELLEWEDGNTDNEDRRGLFVTWGANDKIKIANAGDEIVGIVSATSSVIGNAYEDSWQGMYLTDAFGQPITQIVHHDAEYADVEVPDIDEHGNILDTTHTEQQLLREAYDAEEYAVNPDYDPAQEYIPRSQRREWAKVGMLGQLIVIDDGTCTVGGRCAVGDNGKATAFESGYKVLKRIDDTHIKIFFK